MLNGIQFYILSTAHEAGEAVADTVHQAAGHGGGESHELPNLITFINKSFAHHYDALIFAGFVSLLLITVSLITYRKRQLIPGRLQNFVEMIIEGLNNLLFSVMGKESRHFVPFLGTLFLYIWFMNLLGLIPFMKSSTSSINTTAALAITVFLYVQYTGIRRLGIWGYFHHLLGSPKDAITWAMAPINFPIHVIGELAKPFSLALRLFGNITGEDILIAAFVSLGIMFMGIFGSPIGFPFQIPFILLAMLTSTIQALVFTMLSTIYFVMVLPHEEHEHGH